MIRIGGKDDEQKSVLAERLSIGIQNFGRRLTDIAMTKTEQVEAAAKTLANLMDRRDELVGRDHEGWRTVPLQAQFGWTSAPMSGIVIRIFLSAPGNAGRWPSFAD